MKSQNKYPRNAACPCGTGKKYKKCCINAAYGFHLQDNGAVTKSVPLNDGAMEAFEMQRQAFIEKFGREPEGDDPIFFDPDQDTPQPMSMAMMDEMQDMMVEVMMKSGIRPEIIYAYKRTGFLLTEENYHLATPEDLAEWESAIDEFEVMKGAKRA